MTINKDTLLNELNSAVPDFVIDSDWAQDKLGYLIISDLARYLCEQAELSEWKIVKQGMDFLERSLEAGDPYMHDLVHEALEVFLSCSEVGEMKKHFGLRTQALWNKFMEDTYQQVLRDKDLR